MMGFVTPENREPWLLRSALAVGLALGLVRGFFLKADVDNYGLTRLPGARDGMPVTLLIAAALAVAIVAPLLTAAASAWVPYATSLAGLGATYCRVAPSLSICARVPKLSRERAQGPCPPSRGRVGAETLLVGAFAPLIQTPCRPTAPAVRRAAPAGRSCARRFSTPPRSSDRTASGRPPSLAQQAAIPDAEQLGRLPVRRCTACGRSSTPRIAAPVAHQVQAEARVAKKVRCAPASLSEMWGWVGRIRTSPDRLLVIVEKLRHEHRVEVFRQCEVEDEVKRILASLPCKLAQVAPSIRRFWSWQSRRRTAFPTRR